MVYNVLPGCHYYSPLVLDLASVVFPRIQVSTYSMLIRSLFIGVWVPCSQPLIQGFYIYFMHAAFLCFSSPTADLSTHHSKAIILPGGELKLLERNFKIKEIIYNIIIFHFQMKTLDLKEKQRRKQKGTEQSVYNLFKRRESAKCQV